MAHRNTPMVLITTAEELFGRDGLEAVSLRQIAKAAGQRNPAVVQYHFGDKRGLLQAILEYRMPPSDQRSHHLLDLLEVQDRLGDVRGLLACALNPLLELMPEYRNFVRFLSRAMVHGQMADLMATMVPSHATGSRRLVQCLLAALQDLPMSVRYTRIALTFDFLLHATSDYITSIEIADGAALVDDPFFVDLLDGMTAYVLAPTSATATGVSATGDGDTLYAESVRRYRRVVDLGSNARI